MRRYSDTFDLCPSLVGTMVQGATAVGAPVKVMGFQDVLAVLMVGGCFGTGGNAEALYVKIQECATATGTGADWSDITNEAQSAGSFAFSSLAIADITSPVMYMDKKYAKLSDTNRKAYIRALASLTGTDGGAVKLAVGFLLGKPVDSYYVQNATTQGTGNIHYSKGR